MIKSGIIAVLAIIIFTGCKENLSFRKSKGGMPYRIYEKNKNGAKLKAGNIVKMHVIRKLKDSLTFDSHGKLPVYIPVDTVGAPYDPSEVLHTLKVGDSLIAVQLVDTFMVRYPGQIPPHLKKGDRLTTTYTILDVFTSDSAAMADYEREKQIVLANEIKEVEEWLSKKKIAVQKTARGAFVHIKEPGMPPAADSGKYVSVNYTGTTLAGTVFDSNLSDSFGHKEPLVVKVGQPMGVSEFGEGLKLFGKGGKGTLYIPSLLGYGDRPPQGSGIKPYDHLVFDIEILDISATEPKRNEIPTGQQNIDTSQRR